LTIRAARTRRESRGASAQEHEVDSPRARSRSSPGCGTPPHIERPQGVLVGGTAMESGKTWSEATQEVIYDEVRHGIAKITINTTRPESATASAPRRCSSCRSASRTVARDPGHRRSGQSSPARAIPGFCSGGRPGESGGPGVRGTSAGGRRAAHWNVLESAKQIRCPAQPVGPMIRGLTRIGGAGHMCCTGVLRSQASRRKRARSAKTGPRVGSFGRELRRLHGLASG